MWHLSVLVQPIRKKLLWKINDNFASTLCALCKTLFRTRCGPLICLHLLVFRCITMPFCISWTTTCSAAVIFEIVHGSTAILCFLRLVVTFFLSDDVPLAPRKRRCVNKLIREIHRRSKPWPVWIQHNSWKERYKCKVSALPRSVDHWRTHSVSASQSCTVQA